MNRKASEKTTITITVNVATGNAGEGNASATMDFRTEHIRHINVRSFDISGLIQDAIKDWVKNNKAA